MTGVKHLVASDNTFSSGTVSITGTGGGVTVNTAASKIQVSVAAPVAQTSPTLNVWRNMPLNSAAAPLGTTAFTASHRSVVVQPLDPNMDPFPGNMTVSSMYIPLSISGSTATMSAAYTSIFRIGVYTNNAGTLSLLNSVATSFSTGAANANASTMHAGIRWLSIHSSAWSAQPVFTGGGQYWWATHWSSAGALNQSGNIFGMNIHVSNSTSAGTIGASNVANNATKGAAPFYGAYTATTAALPTAIGTAELNKQGALEVAVPSLLFNNITSAF
jgi:hypothetical protein